MSVKRLLTKYEIESIVSIIKPQLGIPIETAASVCNANQQLLKDQLKNQLIYPDMIPILQQSVSKQYFSSLIQTGTSVGVISAQSIGEKQTQTSVVYDEKIMIKRDNKIIITTIGEYIDNEMKYGKIYEIKTNAFVKLLNNNTQVLTVSQNEKIEWKDISEISKHPVNGGLVKITTESGRQVTTTLSHSHLKKHNDSIIPVLGSDLNIGDRIPVAKKIPMSVINLEYINILDYINNSSDLKQTKCYLNENFAWFLGTYISDGNCTEHGVTIICDTTKDTKEFENNIKKFTDIMELTYTKVITTCLEINKASYNINSTFLALFITSLCKSGGDKRIPFFVFNSPKTFIASFIRAWMDGYGNIFDTKQVISTVLTNKYLIQQFSVLFSYFGIYGKFVSTRKRKIYRYVIYAQEYVTIYHSCIGSNFSTKKLYHYLTISSYNNDIIPYDISRHITKASYKLSMIEYYKFKKEPIERTTLGKLINELKEKSNIVKTVDISNELLFMELAYNSDIVWDKIVDIDVINNTEKYYKHPYVYDFSVKDNETFTLLSGIVVHNTLNSFHKAGSCDKVVVTGVPRVEELLNATKDPKATNCIVFMKDVHKTIKQVRKTIGYNLVELTFGKISKSYRIMKNKEIEPWYESFKIMYGDEFTKYTDCISLKINMDILFEYKLNMEIIRNILLHEYTDMACVFSPDNIGQIDIFVDTSNIELPENRLVFINSKNAIEIYLEEVVQPILYKIIICGIEGIQAVYFREDINSFETDGSNFQKILGLPFIDPSKTTSNNVWDIYESLGIEATRQFLIEEFMGIMEGINICHIQLLVEKMTHGGNISSISRYTMRTEESGPFSKASFEETMDNFIRAGFYGQKEETKGVSSSIICGKRSQIGTGLCELIINVDALTEKLSILSEVKEKTQTYYDEKKFNNKNTEPSEFIPKKHKTKNNLDDTEQDTYLDY